ncbi:MAG: hypothetical protein IAG13_15390 [Deltaproteobacteria bacterium]|nr:hypothetical protein [Nannocystaceae bacterium]
MNSDVANGFCSPTCGPDDACPPGATGNAEALCFFNPASSLFGCVSDIDCVDTGVAEVCMDGYCAMQPTQCVLVCDDTHLCPDDMSCLLGACVYYDE